MNQRNRRLRDHFIAGTEYMSRTDNRGVTITEDGLTTVIQGILFKSAIVKRTIDENGYDTFWINYCNWRTVTTTTAMNACIPGGWHISRGRLYTPKKATITIPDTGWIKLEEPLDTYLNQWA